MSSTESTFNAMSFQLGNPQAHAVDKHVRAVLGQAGEQLQWLKHEVMALEKCYGQDPANREALERARAEVLEEVRKHNKLVDKVEQGAATKDEVNIHTKGVDQASQKVVQLSDDLEKRFVAAETKIGELETKVGEFANIFATNENVHSGFTAANAKLDQVGTKAEEALATAVRAEASVKGGRTGIVVGLVVFVAVTLVVWGGLALSGNPDSFVWGLVWGAFIGGLAGLIVSLLAGGRLHASATARIRRRRNKDGAANKGGSVPEPSRTNTGTGVDANTKAAA